jgi:hypothetical protein
LLIIFLVSLNLSVSFFDFLSFPLFVLFYFLLIFHSCFISFMFIFFSLRLSFFFIPSLTSSFYHFLSHSITFFPVISLSFSILSLSFFYTAFCCLLTFLSLSFFYSFSQPIVFFSLFFFFFFSLSLSHSLSLLPHLIFLPLFHQSPPL